MKYKVLKHRLNEDEQVSTNKNRWINEVVKLNADLFTKEDKSTNKKRWERYKEIRDIGLKIKLPKNFKYKKYGRKHLKTDKQLLKELGTIEFHRRKKAGTLP